jgi:hypothetical protein
VTPYYADPWLTVWEGDCRAVLASLPAESVHTVVTSPPYWGLRDYGSAGQLGLEPTPEEYVANMVAVFREVRRVLRADGTLWLNLGDSYFGTGKGPTHPTGLHAGGNGGSFPVAGVYTHDTLKGKDLVGIPWRVAFALQADGWYLRSDIIWSKPNPMPESVTDRPTRGVPREQQPLPRAPRGAPGRQAQPPEAAARRGPRALDPRRLRRRGAAAAAARAGDRRRRRTAPRRALHRLHHRAPEGDRPGRPRVHQDRRRRGRHLPAPLAAALWRLEKRSPEYAAIARAIACEVFDPESAVEAALGMLGYRVPDAWRKGIARDSLVRVWMIYTEERRAEPTWIDKSESQQAAEDAA